MMKKIILITTLLVLISSHSTFYPMVDKNEECVKPGPAKIYSYHIHLLFFQLNEGNMAGALEIKSKFEKEFKDVLVDHECIDTDHQDYNCMFPLEDYPAGPFPTAQWAVYFLPEYFNTMVPWIMQHRQDYQILIHPNTGCGLYDHEDWALFGGAQWQLNMGAFTHDAPYPEPPFLTEVDIEELQKEQQNDQSKSLDELTEKFLRRKQKN